MQILLVDTDRELLELLVFSLRRAGLTAVPASTTAAALQLVEEQPPDLAVVDVGVGESSGLALVADLRGRGWDGPIIVLSAVRSEDDKVRALELGADDYLTKPFSHRELVARIRARLRRGASEADPRPSASASRPLQIGPLRLDAASHSVTHSGQSVHLTRTEFRLLEALMRQPGTVLPSAHLRRLVWGDNHAHGDEVVRVTMHRVRQKLEQDPRRPQLLLSVPGRGFVLCGEPQGSAGNPETG